MASADRPVALVTGASAGLGEQFARQLAARGNDLVLVARGEARLSALAKELADESEASAEVLPADLTDDTQLESVARRLGDDQHPVDLFVNNAGFATTGRFDRLPVDRELREIRLNVVAVVRLAHAAAQAMVERGRGGIVNVSSVASRQPAPTMATYAATKAYVSSFSHALHEELKPAGVHVMVLEPGFTRTEFQERAGFEEEQARVPEFLWSTAQGVVSEALADLDRRKALSVPGWANKVMYTGASALPASVTRRLAASLINH